MIDKPIVLTKQNVCAVLERRKFQTRRIINPQPNYMKRHEETDEEMKSNIIKRAPFQVGDRAEVKEGYQITESYYTTSGVVVDGIYLANGGGFQITLTEEEGEKFNARKFPHRKTPGRFMYKSLARIFLPIVEARIERPQDISESDAKAEGVYPITTYRTETPYKDAFRWLWVSIHGVGAWERNDWVFVYRWDEIIIKGE